MRLPALDVLKFPLQAGVRPIGATCSNDKFRQTLLQCGGCSAVGDNHAARFRLLVIMLHTNIISYYLTLPAALLFSKYSNACTRSVCCGENNLICVRSCGIYCVNVRPPLISSTVSL